MANSKLFPAAVKATEAVLSYSIPIALEKKKPIINITVKYKSNGKWIIENISITMRTPGNDEDLISGFLYNERIVENINEIEKVEKKR